MSPVLELVVQQSQALWRQALSDGSLGGRPRVRVSPQEAGRPDLPAVQQAEEQAEMWALVSGSVGPSVFAGGAFEGRQGLEGPCLFSRTE